MRKKKLIVPKYIFRITSKVIEVKLFSMIWIKFGQNQDKLDFWGKLPFLLLCRDLDKVIIKKNHDQIQIKLLFQLILILKKNIS